MAASAAATAVVGAEVKNNGRKGRTLNCTLCQFITGHNASRHGNWLVSVAAMSPPQLDVEIAKQAVQNSSTSEQIISTPPAIFSKKAPFVGSKGRIFLCLLAKYRQVLEQATAPSKDSTAISQVAWLWAELISKSGLFEGTVPPHVLAFFKESTTQLEATVSPRAQAIGILKQTSLTARTSSQLSSSVGSGDDEDDEVEEVSGSHNQDNTHSKPQADTTSKQQAPVQLRSSW